MLQHSFLFFSGAIGVTGLDWYGLCGLWVDKWGKQFSNHLYMLQILVKLVVLFLQHVLCHIALHALLPRHRTFERDDSLLAARAMSHSLAWAIA